MKANTTVVVGMSGGVNSSVAAYLLKKQGYHVIGLFMKNWDEKNEDGVCTATEDYRDVVKVANELDIPYYSVNFEKEYMEQVFKHVVHGHLDGKNPSIDVRCNQEVKFGLFKKYAGLLGADYIATGHYARITEVDNDIQLLTGADQNEQTYFLSMLKKEQLKNVIFPLSSLARWEIRELAIGAKLATAAKTDSDGLCYIGEQEFNQFIRDFVQQPSGNIIDDNKGRNIGKHDGLAFYKVGSSYEFPTNDGVLRLTVLEKRYKDNTLIVSEDHNHEKLYVMDGFIESLNLFTPASQPFDTLICHAKTGYRKPNVRVTISPQEHGSKIVFDEPIRALLSGQHIALYSGPECIGGAVIG
ncbi:tRNA 2-thiouridine(34) synthase MnmA [Listeria grandensis]|uniref:tRNA-uridine 2-sulfurtransferase n=1 Tax=Listeria grandensis TaxID=1494963 RepID=A0A7X1CRA9_9LIST|nr:tRNA 2-thiouridine(34) synthase MnmA [Listeria grandensis]MBC1937882.1 tRNA 2-thiouridine(34) synthase MnmA [Listeria grandensis]